MKKIKVFWDEYSGILFSFLIAGVFFYCVAYTTAHLIVRHRRMREPREMEVVSQRVGQIYLRKGGVRLVDLRTGRPLSPRLSWIASAAQGDSIGVFCDLKGRRGFININTGKTLGKGKYRHAWVFSEGLAAVVAPGGRLGFVDQKGEYVIPAVFDYDPDYDYVFHGGFCWVYDSEGRCRVIDRTGQDVLGMDFSFVDKSGEEVTVVCDGDLYGLLDKEMQWLFEPLYDDISVHSESERSAFVVKDGVKRLLSFDGKVLEPFVVDSSGPLRCSDEEDERAPYAPVRFLWYLVGDRMGVLDARTGQMILPALFSDVDLVSGNLFSCDILGGWGKSLFYDLQGRPLGPGLSSQAAR